MAVNRHTEDDMGDGFQRRSENKERTFILDSYTEHLVRSLPDNYYDAIHITDSLCTGSFIRHLTQNGQILVNNKVVFEHEYPAYRMVNNGNLYENFHYFVLIARHTQLVFWMIGGSLLGCVRHKGVIPWDHNINVAMMEGYKRVFETKAIPALRTYGVRTEQMTGGGYKLTLGCNGTTAILVHVMTLVHTGGQKSTPLITDSRYISITPKDLLPFKRLPFGNTIVNIPNNSSTYLSTKFGDNYLTHGPTGRRIMM